MKRYRAKPYEVPGWIMPAVAALRPRKRLPVSQWAEENRILPDGNSIPGPWRNRVTPYLTEIMDTFNSESVEKIIFVKPTQVGGTSAMENMLGNLIDQDPGPTMVVYPSDDLAERTVDAKLDPMIRRCKPLAALYQKTDSKKLQLKFGAMTVYLNGANSPADLSSTNIRYLFLDEVDKYPGASKKESDPVSLAIERTKSYTLNRKIFITSTPTLKTGHIWRAKEGAEAEKHYFVPCPHCGTYIELQFAQLKWPSKDDVPDSTARANMARYVCQVCEGVITDRDKGRMLEAGRWQFVRKRTETPKSVAYWMSTMYSPFTRFSDIAQAFMDSKDDPELLQNFVNSWLAEPWEDTKLKTNADLVLERQTEVPAWELPEWTKLLTGGIDVQDNFRDAARDAMLMQAGVEVEEPAQGAEALRGMSLRDFLIESMARSGEGTTTELLRRSRADLWDTAVRQFFSPTADFPAILDNAIKKSIVQQYALVPCTFELWTSRGTLTDFKPSKEHEYALGGGEFSKVGEGGELKHSSLQTEMLPTRKLDTYGTTFTMTREAFINDDIGFLASMPAQYARKAKRKINRQVYELIYENPAVFDGAALFDAIHRNLIATGSAPSISVLEQMIQLMGMQIDQFGESIMVEPSKVIVPVGMGMRVNQILGTAEIDVEGIGSHTVNVLNSQYRSKIQVVEEGTLNVLAGDKACPWFMVSDPRLVKGVQVDYLNGVTTPTFRRSEKAGHLGFLWDIWLDWGINAVDFRGLLRNNGVKLNG